MKSYNEFMSYLLEVLYSGHAEKRIRERFPGKENEVKKYIEDHEVEFMEQMFAFGAKVYDEKKDNSVIIFYTLGVRRGRDYIVVPAVCKILTPTPQKNGLEVHTMLPNQLRAFNVTNKNDLAFCHHRSGSEIKLIHLDIKDGEILTPSYLLSNTAQNTRRTHR